MCPVHSTIFPRHPQSARSSARCGPSQQSRHGPRAHSLQSHGHKHPALWGDPRAEAPSRDRPQVAGEGDLQGASTGRVFCGVATACQAGRASCARVQGQSPAGVWGFLSSLVAGHLTVPADTGLTSETKPRDGERRGGVGEGIKILPLQGFSWPASPEQNIS